MTSPTTDNAVADFVNGLINALIKGGEVAAEAYITTLDPALMAVPILKWLVDEGVSYLGQVVGAYITKNATSIVIDVQTNGEKSQCVQAALALQNAISSGDKNAIVQATQKAAQAYAGVIHFDGSAK